jgi:3-oxoacyl-[acyl-carrier-protein] synthase III
MLESLAISPGVSGDQAPPPARAELATAPVTIAGLGVALPAAIVANEQIAPGIGVDPGWIERRTGIRERRRVSDGAQLVELAAAAGRAALDDAGVDGALLDLVILATVSQERRLPTYAAQVATSVGADTAGAFDLGAACTGFVSALATATAFIESGRASHVLVVAADTLSRQSDPDDRSTAALFGDGAGAALLGVGRRHGIGAIELGADGGASELITNDAQTGLIRMQGHETFIQAVARMEQATRAVCARAGVDLVDDVDLFVFHQANARITRTLTERLGCEPGKVVDCIAELGNTSSASVPLALEHARADGRLTAGARVLLCSVGAGFTWGAALLEWGDA